MHDINRVVLVGRLTQDPELRSIPSGTAVCNLRIACNSSQREADGEYGERPNYFDVERVRLARREGLPTTCARAAGSASTGAWAGASGRPPRSRDARQ